MLAALLSLANAWSVIRLVTGWCTARRVTAPGRCW